MELYIGDNFGTVYWVKRLSVSSHSIRAWTVGPLSIMQLTGCHQTVKCFYSPESAITGSGWHYGNEMRNAVCVDTQTSIAWPYCPFPILWSGHDNFAPPPECKLSFSKTGPSPPPLFRIIQK